jgi:hypothetical protein
MRDSHKAALLLAIVVTLLASVPTGILAQNTAPKKKTKPTVTSTATANGSSGKVNSGAKKDSSFEIKDFSFGVENSGVVSSKSAGTKEGKVSFSDFTVGATKSPPAVYKGPITLPPNNAPKPNDSAHKKPPH